MIVMKVFREIRDWSGKNFESFRRPTIVPNRRTLDDGRTIHFKMTLFGARKQMSLIPTKELVAVSTRQRYRWCTGRFGFSEKTVQWTETCLRHTGRPRPLLWVQYRGPFGP